MSKKHQMLARENVSQIRVPKSTPQFILNKDRLEPHQFGISEHFKLEEIRINTFREWYTRHCLSFFKFLKNLQYL